MRKSRNLNSSGQAVLLVLLSLAVVLTVAVSFLARSVTEVSITSRSEDSFRAFSAAEAGVEKTLLTGLPSGASGETIGEVKFVTTVNTSTSTEIVFPEALRSGESGMAWLVDHDRNTGDIKCGAGFTCYTGPNIDLCWGDNGSAQVPAVELSVFYDPTPTVTATGGGSFEDLRVARDAIDPDAGRTPPNKFDSTGITTSSGGNPACSLTDPSGEQKKFKYKKTITFSNLGISNLSVNALQFVKVKLLYNSGPESVGIRSAGVSYPFPPQGKTITSIGTAGESTRKLNVFESFGEPPSILDNAVYSPYDLVKSN